jgi:hypothetical protein
MTLTERFCCTVTRDGDGRVSSIAVEATDLEGNERRIFLNGARAARVAASIHDVLRAAGVGSRAWSSSRPIELDQVAGAQVELLLRAVKPLRRSDRIETVGGGIAAMSREEASYWHAKSGHAGGLPALRMLLGDGARR